LEQIHPTIAPINTPIAEISKAKEEYISISEALQQFNILLTWFCPRSFTDCEHLFRAQIEKEIAAVEIVSPQKKSRHKRLFSCLFQKLCLSLFIEKKSYLCPRIDCYSIFICF
jgi:hypothetical protein